MQAKRYNFTRTKLIYRSPSRIWSRFIAGKFIEQFFSKKKQNKKTNSPTWFFYYKF